MKNTSPRRVVLNAMHPTRAIIPVKYIRIQRKIKWNNVKTKSLSNHGCQILGSRQPRYLQVAWTNCKPGSEVENIVWKLKIFPSIFSQFLHSQCSDLIDVVFQDADFRNYAICIIQYLASGRSRTSHRTSETWIAL